MSIVGLTSLSEVTCANIILCVPSTPKVIKDFKETRAFAAVQSYFGSWKSPGDSNKRSNGLEPLELPRIESTKLERLHSNCLN
jgi:hypothetical protein